MGTTNHRKMSFLLYYNFGGGKRSELTVLDLRLFGRHRLCLYHITPEFASACIDFRPGEDWTIGDSQLPTEGISNISGGDGIFVGFSCDTLFFDVVKKGRQPAGSEVFKRHGG